MYQSITLTANRRLARKLIADHDAAEQAAGKTAWSTLACMPLSSWLNELWIHALASGDADNLLLLNEQQSQAVWEIIIKRNDYPLLNLPATIQQVKQARQLLHDYQLNIEHPDFHYTEATKQFKTWVNAFEKHCQHHRFIDNVSLLLKIIELIDKQKIKLPEHITFMGFLDHNPLFEKLISALKKQISVELISPIKTKKNHVTQCIALKNTEDEIIHMANWAKEILKNKPTLRIACIVPELTNLRSKIQRIFSQSLSAEQFNISGGHAIIHEPIIYTALLSLKLANKLAINDISHLLRSPFIASTRLELQKRALLDAKIRKENYLTLNLNSLIKLAKHCPELHAQLKQFSNHLCYEKQKPSTWAVIFSKQLAALGWPGDRSLSSREHQALQQWQTLLENFANLDVIKPPLTLKQALANLQQLAREQLFQVQTNDNAPIQVLGLLETVGLLFDKAWLMGLDDQHWPSPAKPNPFLPINLQRQHGLPHADALRELHFAKQMQHMLQSQCQQLILSYPEQEDDCRLMQSRLLLDVPVMQAKLKIQDAIMPVQTEIEALKNDPAPPSSEKEKITGGSAIFKAQAACPFRAFAHYRLQADSIATPELGLTAAERGILVHQVLEQFWQQLSSHAQLCELSQDLLDQTLSNLIQQAMRDQLDLLQLPKRLLVCEQERLLKLLKQWLEIEKSREPFWVVAHERWQSITVGGIPLRLQIDRIDRLQDGSFIIIDYKTGLVSMMNWLGDRPDDPQLPLYAISNRENLSGLYFAQIRADKIAFKGLNTDNSDDWPAQLNEWQAVLEQLAQDFHAGIADVDPKYAAQTCQYCDLSSLCRIHER